MKTIESVATAKTHRRDSKSTSHFKRTNRIMKQMLGKKIKEREEKMICRS
jgi:hypothetical protein